MRVFSAEGSVEALAWSADGKHLAEARSGAGISIRDVATGEVIRTWNESKPCHALAFGPDGSLFARVGKQITRYTPSRTKLYGSTTHSSHLQVCNGVLLTGDGHRIELESGKLLPKVEPPAWVVDDIRLAALALAPSGEIYAVAWDVDDCRQHKLALAFVETRTGEVRSWLTQGEYPPPGELFFSADSRSVYSARILPEGLYIDVFGENPGSRTLPVCEVIASNGSHLCCSLGSAFTLHEAGTWRRVSRIEAPIEGIRKIAISPDSAAIALANASGEVAINERK